MFRRLRLAFPVRFVLAWFVLSLAAAIASPALQGPQAQPGDCVQPGNGHKDGTPAHGHTLECPLCVPLAAPPDAAGKQALAEPQPRETVAHVADALAALTAS